MNMPTPTTPEQKKGMEKDEGSIASRTRRSKANDASDQTFEPYRGTEADLRYFLVSCVEQAIKGNSIYLCRPTKDMENLLRKTVLNLSTAQLMKIDKSILLEKVKPVIRPMAMRRTKPGSEEPYQFIRGLLKEQGPKANRLKKSRKQEQSQSSPPASQWSPHSTQQEKKNSGKKPGTEDSPLDTKKYEQPSLLFTLKPQSDSSESFKSTQVHEEEDTPKAAGGNTHLMMEEMSMPEAQPNDQLIIKNAQAMETFMEQGSITDDWIRRGSLSSGQGVEEVKEPPSDEEGDQPPVQQIEARHLSQGSAHESERHFSHNSSEDMAQYWNQIQSTLERLDQKEKFLDDQIAHLNQREETLTMATRQAEEAMEQLAEQINQASDMQIILHKEVKTVRAIYKDWANRLGTLENMRTRTATEIMAAETPMIKEQVQLLLTRELAKAEAQLSNQYKKKIEMMRSTSIEEYGQFDNEIKTLAARALQTFKDQATTQIATYNSQLWQDIDSARAHVGDETVTIRKEVTELRQEIQEVHGNVKNNQVTVDQDHKRNLEGRIQTLEDFDWETFVQEQIAKEMKEVDMDRFMRENVPEPQLPEGNSPEARQNTNMSCHSTQSSDCGCGPWKADMEKWRNGVDLLQGQLSMNCNEVNQRLDRHLQNYKNWRTTIEDNLRQNPTTPPTRRFYPIWKNPPATTEPAPVTPDPAAHARAENIRHNLRKYQSADVPEIIADDNYDELAVTTFYESFRTTATHYNIELVPLDDLAQEGTVESHALRVLPNPVRRSISETIYNKLQSIIPPEVKSMRSIIDCYAMERDGYKSLYSIMQQNCEELKMIPKRRGPQWKRDEDGWRYLGKFKRYLHEEERRGVTWTEYQKAINILQGAMDHPRYETKATAFLAALLTASRQGEADWAPFEMHRLMGSLEEHNSRNNPIDLTEDTLKINRFGNSNGPRGRTPSPRRPRREIQCEMCHNFGHNIDQDPCRIGAQCYHCLQFLESQPEKAKQNAKAYSMMNQARTVKQMEMQLPHLTHVEREHVVYSLSTAMASNDIIKKNKPPKVAQLRDDASVDEDQE